MMLTQLVIDLNSHLEKPILDHSYLEFWLRIHSKTLPKTDEIDSTNFIQVSDIDQEIYSMVNTSLSEPTKKSNYDHLNISD